MPGTAKTRLVACLLLVTGIGFIGAGNQSTAMAGPFVPAYRPSPNDSRSNDLQWNVLPAISTSQSEMWPWQASSAADHVWRASAGSVTAEPMESFPVRAVSYEEFSEYQTRGHDTWDQVGDQDPWDDNAWPSMFDDSPRHSLTAFVGYDSWHSHTDGTWSNNGLHTGANYGTRLGQFSEVTRIGAQVGGSVGIYNWSGSNYRVSGNEEPTTQGFVTYGLFRRAYDGSRAVFAVTQDWMINNNYSVMGEDMALSQIRAQLGYVLNDRNELGAWSAIRVIDDTREVAGIGPVTWRAVNQYNVYWHRKWFECGADTWIWFGVPEQERLTGNGSLGDYIAGASAVAPLGERMSIYTSVSYMHPSGSPGPAASAEEAWNFYSGISFHLQRNSFQRLITGQAWNPLIPIAHNGTFLVDASASY